MRGCVAASVVAGWYEIFDMTRKVLLTGFVAFMAPGTASQVLAALLITICALAVTSQVKPFMRNCDDFGNIVMHYQV